MSNGRKIYSSQKTYKAANLRKFGPGTLTPLAAGATVDSAWVGTTDFSKIVGVCFTATSASMQFPISGSTVGGKFFITGSDGTIYTYSASLNATASLAVLITSASVGSQFFITGSDSLIYTYSASMNATASLAVAITSASLGAQFFITGSNSLIYTYSASLNATASLAYTLTTGSVDDSFILAPPSGYGYGIYTYNASLSSTASLAIAITTASLGDKFYFTSSAAIVYTYSASQDPIPTDAPPIFYFPTGSTLDESVANLKDEINISIMSSSISASVATSTLLLKTKAVGSTGNSIGFQSGSTQELFTGGHDLPVDSGNVFYFDVGMGAYTLANFVVDLKDKINQSSSGSTWVTASAATSVLTLKAKAVGTDGNTMYFQSGSTTTNFAGGSGVPADTANRIYYFNIGSGIVAINTVTINLKDEINNSTANTFITASSATNNLTLGSKTMGTTGNSIGFQSGSTQNLLSGGSVVHIDDNTNRIYYFDIGQGIFAINTVAANLKDEINNTAPNTFLSASVAANSLLLWATSVGTAGNTMGFKSGSTTTNFTGGDGVPADNITNRIFYFDNTSGSLIAQSVANLVQEINNSTANTFVIASSATNWLTLRTTLASSIGDAIGFESGSVQESLVQAGLSDGTLYVQQTLNTASIDITGSAISFTDSSGGIFEQTLYSEWVRIKYTQTGSIASNFLKIYTYLVP